MPHVSVLLDEVLELFKSVRLIRFLDGTLGAGGHAEALLQAHPEIEKYVGLDRDPVALGIAATRLEPWKEKVELRRGAFAELAEGSFDGILLDLGVSSMQLDEAERGFSFRGAGPLDMRMDPDQELTAWEIVNRWGQKALLKMCVEYEVPRPQRVVEALLERRRKKTIDTTAELAELVRPVIGRGGRSMDPATLLFQALRLAVNDELGQLQQVLPKAMEQLTIGGRLAVISFHSLEDRIVKQTMRQGTGVRLVTKKSISPSEAEVRRNRRARSARLRCVEKTE
jgi:16S rRNA (cytosine1402-N4)-methyltransferase